jgi:predicted peptidase
MFKRTTLIATSALDQTRNEANIDSTRIYLMGQSMGAIRSWEILYERPTEFAASVPIAGLLCGWCITGDRSTSNTQMGYLLSKRIPKVALWIFHGALDHTAEVADDRALVPILKAAGINVRYTEYADGPHDVWGRAYQDPALWAWLFAQHR